MDYRACLAYPCNLHRYRPIEVVSGVEPAVEIRPYRSGDEQGIVELFARCFNREVSVEYWRWKMKSASVDYETIWLAIRGNEIVGHYGGVPFDAWINSTRSMAIVSVDSMVVPAMRRQGILSRMVRSAHDHWRNAGVRLVIGLPNEKWGSRTAALGWVPMFPLQWLTRILRPESILARRSGLGAFARLTLIGAMCRRGIGRARTDSRIDVARISEPHPHLDRIAECLDTTSTVQRCRSAEWIRQRYLSSPGSEYRVLLATMAEAPVGYGVYSLAGKDSTQATIAEIVCHDLRSFFAIFAEIESRALAAGAESIRALAIPGTTGHRYLRLSGFFPRKRSFPLHIVPLDPVVADAKDVGSWRFEGGDFDIV